MTESKIYKTTKKVIGMNKVERCEENNVTGNKSSYIIDRDGKRYAHPWDCSKDIQRTHAEGIHKDSRSIRRLGLYDSYQKKYIYICPLPTKKMMNVDEISWYFSCGNWHGFFCFYIFFHLYHRMQRQIERYASNDCYLFILSWNSLEYLYRFFARIKSIYFLISFLTRCQIPELSFRLNF